MAEVKPQIETAAKIKVLGVGGGGGSAISRMIAGNVQGVEFVAVNTDVQALHANPAAHKIPIGKTVTRGLGAGMNPEVGKRSAEESANDIRSAISGADMVFLTGGLGGGTGSGALPEIAKTAKEAGALTVAVVTKPFSFEGAQRKRIADDAYTALAQHVDTIITIPNDRVLQIIDKKTSLVDAFQIVDDVLRQGVQGIADIITLPGMINVDFADVKAIMEDAGSALMGIGGASGENRAVEAAKEAIASPLLELSIDGAKGILFTITGSPDLAMYEVAEAAKVITGSADDDARVIFGAHVDESLQDEVRITVVATGFDNRERRKAPSLAGDVEIAPQSSWNMNQVRSSGSEFGKTSVRSTHAEDDASSDEEVSAGGGFMKRRVEPEERQEIEKSIFRKPIRSRSHFEEEQDQEEDSSISPQDRGHVRDFDADSGRVQAPSRQKKGRRNHDKDDDDDNNDLGIPAFIRRKMM